MKIKCVHGYFIFEEASAGEISKFSSIYGFEITRRNDHYTFDFLKDIPDYTIVGNLFLGVPAIKTCEGDPWYLMQQNQVVYNFITNLVQNINTITVRADISKTANYYISSGLVLPASFTDEGVRVTDYTAWHFSDSAKFKYTDIV